MAKEEWLGVIGLDEHKKSSTPETTYLFQTTAHLEMLIKKST